jgi:hypothetical protein
MVLASNTNNFRETVMVFARCATPITLVIFSNCPERVTVVVLGSDGYGVSE